MASSGMLRRVALVRTDVSEELKANVVPSSQLLVTLVMEALSSSETSVLTRATQRNVTENAIFYSHLRENLKSYINNCGQIITFIPEDLIGRH
jgi:hypothetical protein